MKKLIYIFVAFLILLFMVLHPQEAVAASKTGLLLWFNTIIPTLLPFIILSNLIIRLNGMKYITFWIAPLLHKVFGISREGSYAVIAGFVCGYPMGAKIIADLRRAGKITVQEGNYLLCFCNNVSPMFIMSYIVTASLKAPQMMGSTLILLYLAPVLCAVIFNIRFRREQVAVRQPDPVNEKKNLSVVVNFQLLDQCIMDGFETIVKLGGYIILFCIITQIALNIPVSHPVVYFLVGNIEVTNGIQTICASPLGWSLTYIFVLAAASFGGLSSIAQTESMIRGSGLSLGRYFSAKITSAAITALASACYVFILR